MKKLLLITTTEDLSLPLFFTREISAAYEIQVLLVEDLISHGPPKGTLSVDKIYVRDLYNNQYLKLDEVKSALTQLLGCLEYKTTIDNIADADKLDFEDKWTQYRLLSRFMPQTSLVNEQYQSTEKEVYKLRISSRTRGMHFALAEIEKSQMANYIAQKRLQVSEEYRVLGIKNEILKIGAKKSSRSETTKGKVIGKSELSEDIIGFCNEVLADLDFDFVGLDIVRDINNKLYLLEVNRSPQVKSYYQLTGINPFEILLS